jgi:S1-C subfamily serine protease
VTVRRVLLILLAAAIASVSAAGASNDDARSAVVRVEVGVDPLSAGPGLAAELAARQPWTAYQAEVARRLRIGSSGTGFFVNSRGDVVTNAHVVLSGVRYRGLHFTRAEWDSMARLLEAIREVWVTVGEGPEERSYPAVPMAVAEDLDLAVLRISLPPEEQTRFSFLPIGSSDRLAVGARVRALGFPENGFQETSGEILSLITGSAVHQQMNLVRRVDPATGRETITVSGTSLGPVNRLQHSAPVGHGSSGGPILDQQGRAVGVAYGFLSDRRPDSEEEAGVEGLNLAIASNVLKRFLSSQGVAFKEAAE